VQPMPVPVPRVEKVPAAHVPVTLEAPAVQKDPAGHAVHAATAAPPVEYDPALHCPEGAPRPFVEQYHPAVHDVHVMDPAAAKVPARHCTGATALLLHWLPAGHCVHAVVGPVE
jgi:hypothetical protein